MVSSSMAILLGGGCLGLGAEKDCEPSYELCQK